MATMISKVYQAFGAVGMPEDKARKAAADLNPRPGIIETGLTLL